MGKKEAKTNAMRLLDRAGAAYRTHTYAQDDGAIDGVSVAGKLGQPLEQVFKTLVTVGHSGAHYVFVIPVAEELDLKAAARAVGEKSVEMLPLKDLTRVTGYVRGGCSPLGMKKPFPVCVDESCLGLPAVIFSGGRIGCQIEMEPRALLKVTGAGTAALTVAHR